MAGASEAPPTLTLLMTVSRVLTNRKSTALCFWLNELNVFLVYCLLVKGVRDHLW